MRLLPAIVISLGASLGHAAEIAPGAVVSSDGRTVYLRVPRGGTEARSVERGALLWRTADDLRPLAASGGRVLCQRAGREGRLDLALLDAATGRPAAEAVFQLPEGVSSPLDETLGTRFDLQATAEGPRVLLAWRFERRPVRGAHFEEEHGEDRDDDVEGDESLRAEGAVAVALETARVTAASADAPRPLPLAVDQLARAGALLQTPLPVGSSYVTARLLDGRPSLARFTAAGAALPPVPLPEGARVQRGSADGRHVLVSVERPGAPLETAHEWTVIALDTGAVAATLRAPVAASGFQVAGGRVLLALEAWGRRAGDAWRDEPRRLEAKDATGAPVWTEALRDPAYSGPVAP